jgi:hypothetical protein
VEEDRAVDCLDEMEAVLAFLSVGVWRLDYRIPVLRWDIHLSMK